MASSRTTSTRSGRTELASLVAGSGSVSLDFGKKHVKLGSVAGNDQAAMWAHFRAFLAGTATLYDNSRLALESLDGEK